MMKYLPHVRVGLTVVDGFEKMAAAQQEEIGKTRFAVECREREIISIFVYATNDRMFFAIPFHPGAVVGNDLVRILRGGDIHRLLHPTRPGPKLGIVGIR